VGCLCAAWLAVTQARAIGINFLFSVMVLVWVADIGAYFSGRALGGKLFARKLAPTISPGKTWEGVFGGLLGVALCALLWIQVEQYVVLDSVSIYSKLRQQGWLVMAIAIVWLVAWSVVGDLVESLIKRSAGVKDSSNLLPGHGGVLDRLDALLPVLPMAMMLQSL
jgi:phosphatidate cytidylyltransferase